LVTAPSLILDVLRVRVAACHMFDLVHVPGPYLGESLVVLN
jgi:hypothetical protein